MKLVKKSKWNGFERQDYIYNDKEVIVIVPNIAQNNKWVWRTEFFNAFAYADIEMLNRGYTLVYYCISDLFGAPYAIGMMYDFHRDFIERFSLDIKAILFGFSRGGLYAYNYACKYPQNVLALYLDAPVLDICSWPGGFMSGEGDDNEWKKCLKAYEYKDDAEAKKYSFIDKIDILLDAKIPIIIVAGDSDKVVPYKENGKLLQDYYEKKHGNIKVILKKGVGHHPHSLEDPTPIVSFLEKV